MKTVIIVFSPSGHTLKVAEMIKKQCEKHASEVKLINITGKNEFLFDDHRVSNLQEELGYYDLLFVGGPIYAGHIEHNIINSIKALPTPDNNRKNIAVPFVSYGGVHSSVALQEMGTLLKKKEYKSILGIKIAAKHTLTQTFSKVIYPNKPNEQEEALVDKAVEQVYEIIKKGNEFIKDQSKAFKYSSLKKRIIFKIFTQEKIHTKFKQVHIDYDKCIVCEKCIAVCPVNMFDILDNKIKMYSDNTRCILCAECFHHCPTGAIVHPYIEKAKMRLQDGNTTLEKIPSAIYPAE